MRLWAERGEGEAGEGQAPPLTIACMLSLAGDGHDRWDFEEWLTDVCNGGGEGISRAWSDWCMNVADCRSTMSIRCVYVHPSINQNKQTLGLANQSVKGVGSGVQREIWFPRAKGLPPFVHARSVKT